MQDKVDIFVVYSFLTSSFVYVTDISLKFAK